MINYRGEDIRLDDTTGIFRWEGIESANLKDIHAAIDKEKKKPRLNAKVLYARGYDASEINEAVVTSVQGRGGWISCKGSRSKLYNFDDVYEYSGPNLTLVKQIADIDQQAEELNEARTKLVSRLTKWTAPKQQEEK